MTEQTKLNSDDAWLLQRAYLLKPESGYGISSLALFDDDVEAHNAFDFSVFQRLTILGYIVGVEYRTWDLGNRSANVAIFQFTPLGLAHAEKLVGGRRRYSIREHLLAVNRSDWIALLALLVAIFALFQAGK